MTFSELLKQYMDDLGCSTRELAEASGLSAAVLSRYRTGIRVPTLGGKNLSLLAEGLCRLSNPAKPLSVDTVLEDFTALLRTADYDYDRLADKLNLLIEAADININRLARFINYDASFISRIRAGSRRPADPDAFVDGVCRYVSTTDTGKKASIASLLEKKESELRDPRVFYNALLSWFCLEAAEKQEHMDHYLSMLDSFDLNDYIRSIHFDELKVPSLPFQFSTAKSYYGLEQMRAGELDFFKATVLSHAGDSLFMCSDMDVTDMAKDKEFGKKWMFAIAMCLKKGLHLDMIHTLDRPFEEMMLGLEGWLPIYMTGQISPYYLKGARSNVYQHLNYVSGAAALTGECIAGHHNKGKYYLTKKADEIAFYREKSEWILKKAFPLMDIYRKEQADAFLRFVEEDSHSSGERHEILSVPPLYTIPDDLLSAILSRHHATKEECTAIEDLAHRARQRMEWILRENTVLAEIPRITPEEFAEYPCYLPLDELFLEKDFSYTYEEYLRHMEATKSFADLHKKYTAQFHIRRSFRRIQISIHKGEFALVSKAKAPAIQFVIRHEKLRDAIENLILPIVENT